MEQSNTICEIALKKRRPKDLHFKEYIKLDRDKSTFKSHRDFNYVTYHKLKNQLNIKRQS